MMIRGLALCAALLFLATAARAADENTFKSLQAPTPAKSQPFPANAKATPIRFARVVVQLRPEPWALVRINGHVVGEDVVGRSDHYVTWSQGQRDVNPSTVGGIFNDEMRAAGVPIDGATDSLFSQESTANVEVGVKIRDIKAYLCQYCGHFNYYDPDWTGVVTMEAHWEIYSKLDRKVIATIDTQGGFATGKKGIEGSSEQLINEAFRDNVRRLVNSEAFRKVVLSTPAQAAAPDIQAQPAIRIVGPKVPPGLRGATSAVTVVFANDGSGSGFLISPDGYVLTNRHVVGASKYVKLKWADGAETLGEVVRSDPRRDVALVKTDPGKRSPLALRLTDVEQGEAVYAIGSPLGEAQQNTMTKGIVSAKRVRDGLSYIQSDVAVTHGSSGGPLLDARGAVVGLTVSGLEANGAPLNLNFFIPIDDALKALALQPAS